MSLSDSRSLNTTCTITKPIKADLATYYHPENLWEIGVDEAGRGPLFGRLYVAAAILPKEPDTRRPACHQPFRHSDMKDSKKFHSEKKIREVAEYIKTHAVAWHVHYIDEGTIDQINIRQAVLRAMHECCRQCILQISAKYPETQAEEDFFLLIDGNDFVPYTQFDERSQSIVEIPHQTVEGGDNQYTPIAAASILAKVARDEYVKELCVQYPDLDRRYGITKNKGYGTKRHLDGIREHGISQWHRRSFGLCKTSPQNPVSNEPVENADGEIYHMT